MNLLQLACLFLSFIACSCGNSPILDECDSSVPRQEFDCAKPNKKTYVQSMTVKASDLFICTPATSFGALLKDGCAGITIPLCTLHLTGNEIAACKLADGSLDPKYFACAWADGSSEVLCTHDKRLDKNVCVSKSNYDYLLSWLKTNC